jgi:hypothetical protein
MPGPLGNDRHQIGRPERIVEFAVGEQPGIGVIRG